VISLPLPAEHAERFIQSGVPIVLIDGFHAGLNHVVVDDVDGGYRATQHLIQLGHQKIGFISDYLDMPLNFKSMKYRLLGYCQALQEAGLPYRPEYQAQGLHGRLEAREMARKLLALPDPPTAIFAASDTQAIGVLDAAQEMGIAIPEALSVIGYDGIRDAEYVNLTTIQQPLFESGILGVEMLFTHMNEKQPEIQEIILPIEIVERSTTAAPRNA